MSDDVERIAKAEFRKSHGPHHPGSPTADEIDWWATKDRRRIGTVLRDVVDGDYSWVALAPTHSLMVADHLGTSIATREEATQRLRAALASPSGKET